MQLSYPVLTSDQGWTTLRFIYLLFPYKSTKAKFVKTAISELFKPCNIPW